MGWFKNIVNTIKDVTLATVVQPVVSTVNAVGIKTSQPKYSTGIGKTLGDVAKSAAQPLSSTVNAFGAKTSTGKYDTDVGKFLGDLGKVGAEPIKSSYGSITGKDNDFVYETKVGKNIGGVVELGVDSGHVALKTYADTLSGGLVSKAINVVRDDEHKESAGNYNEQKKQIFTSGSTLGKVENVVMKGAPIVGTVGASLLKSKDEGKKEGTVKPVEKSGAVANGSVKVVDAKGLGDGIGTGTVSSVPKVVSSVSNTVKPVTKVAETVATKPIVATVVKPVIKVAETVATKPIVATAVKTVTKTEEKKTMASGNIWGDIASSVLGSAVTAMIDNSNEPKAQQQQQTASIAAFTNPYVNAISDPKLLGTASAAAFGLSGTSQAPAPAPPDSWWDQNKSWAMPVSIVLSIVFSFVFLIMAIVKRRR